METWKLMLLGVAVHIILFYSIFDIYFTSPIVHGMQPYSSKHYAQRLVLFSADGLRADKMFELDSNGETRIPYIRSMIETKGAWGVSHTRVPTESRPGHVALIAGFYEDVSAVAKGWKENPVEFDSVFNESRYTWSWGSPDVLPMFAKGASGNHVFTKCYPADFEDFGGSGHSRLDTWVFDEVKKFFEESKSNKMLYEQLHKSEIVFFLHLLGLDTTGHSKKPYSNDYLNNIRLVDKGIHDVVMLIEDYYGDGATAYVMTADHGMTDWGSHGAGHPSETMTPLVAWGSGIRGPIRNKFEQFHDDYSKDWNLSHIKRVDVEQADIAPLMAALIGINFPMNSVGILPYDYLNMQISDLVETVYTNTKQLLEQFKVKMELKKSTTLPITFRPFSELTAAKMADQQRHIRNLIQNGHFKEAINECMDLMKIILKGLNYYQTYDRFFLGASIFFAYLGWMLYVLTVVFEEHSGIVQQSVKIKKQDRPLWRLHWVIVTLYAVAAVIITVLLNVQSLPWTNYLYCLLPIFLWMAVTLRLDIFLQVYHYARHMDNRNSFILAVTVCLVGLEILVIGFFYREVLSVGLVLMAAILLWYSATDKFTLQKPVLLWSFSSLLLSVFPALPVVTGKRNTTYVLFGGLIVIVGFLASFVRAKIWKTQSRREVILSVLQILAVVMATYYAGIAISSGLSSWQQVSSWIILGNSVLSSLLCSTVVWRRLQSIFLAFIAPSILLSVSYEILFTIGLCMLLCWWLQAECAYIKTLSSNQQLNKKQLFLLDMLDFHNPSDIAVLHPRRHLVIIDILRAFYVVFLILTAFFGTGNIASINSFDPASVLCFVSVFSPFVMGALLLFKVIIPFIYVACTLQAVHVITRLPIQGLFLLILLMSDCMALDHGSWLDIGTSISHYIIVMCMIIFLMVLFGVSHLLTSYSIFSRTTRKRLD